MWGPGTCKWLNLCLAPMKWGAQDPGVSVLKGFKKGAHGTTLQQGFSCQVTSWVLPPRVGLPCLGALDLVRGDYSRVEGPRGEDWAFWLSAALRSVTRHSSVSQSVRWQSWWILGEGKSEAQRRCPPPTSVSWSFPCSFSSVGVGARPAPPSLNPGCMPCPLT